MEALETFRDDKPNESVGGPIHPIVYKLMLVGVEPLPSNRQTCVGILRLPSRVSHPFLKSHVSSFERFW